METTWHHQKRKLTEKYHGEKRRPNKEQPTGRSVNIQACQKQARSRDRGIIKQRCREFRNVKDKRLPRDHAVDGRANQAVSGCSYWLSLVCIGSSPSRNFRHPACPGSTCICNAQMMQIHWFWSACKSILRMCFDDNSDSGG